MTDANTVTKAGIAVVLPSGSSYLVLTNGEEDYLTERVQRYLADNDFVNISDIQDLDSLVIYELLQWRYQQYIGRGVDWFDKAINEPELRRAAVDFNNAVRQTKKLLGIDKTSRDRVQGEGTTADHWAKLVEYAGRFGVLRNQQLVKALTLTNQLIGLITTHDNLTPQERIDMGLTMDHVVDWIRKVYIPEYLQLDQWFRQRGPEAQQIWIREL